ncbi:hypothetical protein LPJ64_001713 [Coemansia asiatica]|uniref:Uncharacterized protein n=1 Tax=Coemansia asiatica TaxID=1052880 RepID=A0A9W8CLR3_9FUNG|nr:hypothetical protein LPJ64_001713 [Coemansia asiatica]
MQFFKKIVSFAAIAASVAIATDWTSDATLECSKQHWAEIKSIADQILPFAPQVLPAENVAALNQLLNGASVMPDVPTDDFLRALPNAIPVDVLEELAGTIIAPCLNTYVASSASPTSVAQATPTVTPTAAPTQEPDATSTSSYVQVTTTSDAPDPGYTTGIPTSTPSKCGSH